jgi:hypothetical protein
MDVCNQLHATAVLRPVKEPLYSLDRGLGLNSSGEEKIFCIFQYIYIYIYLYIYLFIYIYLLINCNWVVARWQYTFTHKQYIEQHK